MYDSDLEPDLGIARDDLRYAGYFESIDDPVERDAVLSGYIKKEGIYGGPRSGSAIGTALLNAFTRYIPTGWQDKVLDIAGTAARYLDKKKEDSWDQRPEGSSLDSIDIPEDYIMVFNASYNLPHGAKVETSFTRTHRIINYRGTRMGVIGVPRGQEESAILTDALCRGGARNFYYVGSAGGMSENLKPGDLFYVVGEVGTRSPIPEIYRSHTKVSEELNDALGEASQKLDLPLKEGRIYDTSGFLREETPERVDELLSEGYDAVEMELGAICAVANSYGGSATGIMRVVDHLRDENGERLNSGKRAHYVSSLRNAILGSRLAAEAIHQKNSSGHE